MVATEVAEQIKTLHESGACGGIAPTFPLWHPEEIERFTEGVLPILEQMGIWGVAVPARLVLVKVLRDRCRRTQRRSLPPEAGSPWSVTPSPAKAARTPSSRTSLCLRMVPSRAGP